MKTCSLVAAARFVHTSKDNKKNKKHPHTNTTLHEISEHLPNAEFLLSGIAQKEYLTVVLLTKLRYFIHKSQM